MCISLFYAMLIGAWLLIVSSAMLVKKAEFVKMTYEFINDAGRMVFAGMVVLGLGLLIVITHNIWVFAWPTLITLLGWGLVIQGTMRLFTPHLVEKWMKGVFSTKQGYLILAWGWLLIGAILFWAGFFS